MIQSMKVQTFHITRNELKHSFESFSSRVFECIQRKESLTYFLIGDEAFIKPLSELLPNAVGEVCAATTCGEIHRDGYETGSLLIITLYSDDESKHSFFAKNYTVQLSELEDQEVISKLKESVDAFRLKILTRLPEARFYSTVLIDGLSHQEEALMSSLYKILVGAPILGGSAADNFNFSKTLVFDGRQFKQGIASFQLCATDANFTVFKIQDFGPTDSRMIITASNPRERIVHEINGMRATLAYAEAIGVDESELGLEHFSNHPLIVNLGGTQYLRSARGVLPDGSIQFACAIESGMVLRLGRRNAPVSTNMRTFIETLEIDEQARFSLVFECGHRQLDVNNATSEERDEYFNLLGRMNAHGMHTYGEQFHSVHINHTLTGICFETYRKR